MPIYKSNPHVLVKNNWARVHPFVFFPIGLFCSLFVGVVTQCLHRLLREEQLDRCCCGADFGPGVRAGWDLETGGAVSGSVSVFHDSIGAGGCAGAWGVTRHCLWWPGWWSLGCMGNMYKRSLHWAYQNRCSPTDSLVVAKLDSLCDGLFRALLASISTWMPPWQPHAPGHLWAQMRLGRCCLKWHHHHQYWRAKHVIDHIILEKIIFTCYQTWLTPTGHFVMLRHYVFIKFVLSVGVAGRIYKWPCLVSSHNCLFMQHFGSFLHLNSEFYLSESDLFHLLHNGSV